MTDYNKAKRQVASRISTLMQERGLDRENLSKQSGVPAMSIHNAMQGTSMPRSDIDRKRIAQALGTTMDELFAEVIAFRLEVAAKAAETNRRNKLEVQSAKERELKHVAEQFRQTQRAKVERVDKPSKRRAKPATTCQRGTHYMQRMSSSVVVPRCCALDECLARQKQPTQK